MAKNAPRRDRPIISVLTLCFPHLLDFPLFISLSPPIFVSRSLVLLAVLLSDWIGCLSKHQTVIKAHPGPPGSVWNGRHGECPCSANNCLQSFRSAAGLPALG